MIGQPSWADTCNTRRVAAVAVQKSFMCSCLSVAMIIKIGLGKMVVGQVVSAFKVAVWRRADQEYAKALWNQRGLRCRSD